MAESGSRTCLHSDAGKDSSELPSGEKKKNKFWLFRRVSGCRRFSTYRAPAAHVVAPPEHDHVVTAAQAHRVTRPERKTPAGRHHHIKLYNVFVWGTKMKEDLGLSLWG